MGCSQLAFTKSGVLIDVEGDPASPVNQARQCPKGANTFELATNPHRVARVKYRAPRSRVWEDKPLDWVLDRIAQRLWESRERGFVAKSEAGITVNQAMVTAMIKLARSLNFRVIAEHVEDMSALDSAKRMGVDFVQGYQVGRPQPLALAS